MHPWPLDRFKNVGRLQKNQPLVIPVEALLTVTPFFILSSDHATLQNSTQSLPYLLPALHKERGKLRVEHH
jgi:hypothetical protein